MTTRAFSHLLMALALTVASVAASADVIQYTDRTTFSSLGSISFNYDFDDLNTASGGGFLYPGDPWTTHGITYNTSGDNLVLGPSSGYGVASNVFTSNSGGPIAGNVSGSYNLFGFDMGSILGASSENIVVDTNLGTYNFLNQSIPNEAGNAFFGFRAGTGEFFTSFLITDLTTGTYAALDGVTLGVAPVPEPNMLSMMIAGLLLLALAAYRRTKTD